MPFNFDESNPSDNFLIPAAPANHRASRQAIKDSINVEHESTEGRHKFVKGDASAQSGITNWQNGSLFFRSDVVSGEVVLQRFTGSTWEDVAPPANVPRVDSQGQFTASQFAAWEEVTPTPGTPDTLAVDLAASPLKWATLVGDTVLLNPVGSIASHGTVVSFDIVQGATAFTLTYQSAYKAPGNVVQVGGANTRTLLTLQVMPTGSVLVSSIPDWNGTIT